MAIDSREKRQSAYGIFHVKGIPAVTPNAANDQEWRQEVYWGYSGILVEAPVVTPESAFGVSSIIDSTGQGIAGAISSIGQGVTGSITASFGVSSIIDNTGQGVVGEIDETGQGVTGLI